VTLWQRVISGDGRRRTRLHDHEQRACSLQALVGLPRAAATGALLKAFGWRPEAPWLGFSAVRCIEQLLQPHWCLLEFGSGMSTIWFARRVGQIVSIETNPEWHSRVTTLLLNRGLSERVENRLVPVSLEGLASTLPRVFDFALVDGSSRDVATALALSVVKPGGYIYLDNSDVPALEYRDARKQLLNAAATARLFTDFCDGQVAVTQGLLVQTRTLEY
jgi:hypothetical protein